MSLDLIPHLNMINPLKNTIGKAYNKKRKLATKLTKT